KNQSKVELFFCTMAPIFSGHRLFLSGTRDWFDQIQALIPQIAKAQDATLIDNNSAMAARIDLFEDYLHTNHRGTQLIAENIAPYIKPIQQALSLHETFGNHMVLQSEVINKIRGKASANETVTIEFKNKKYHTISNRIGNWEIDLPAQSAGGPFSIKVRTTKSKIELTDVLFGDVYLSSGQSNMA